ncbi:MAG: nucleotidyltransferase domain-containing protein [Saprospiraceae bacterium]
MMTKQDVLDVLKESKPHLNEKFKIAELGLFGSYSTGNNNPESDIDILYLLEEGKQLGIEAIYELEEYMKKVLKVDRLDLVNRKYLNPIIELEIEDSLVYV